MHKNEIFKRFMKSPSLKELVELTEDQINLLNINSDCSDPLINVIRISILSIDHNPSVDSAARKINQLLRKEEVPNRKLWGDNN